MNRYRIFETPVFEKDFLKVTQPIRNEIRSKFNDYVYPQLRYEPHWGLNIKKLRNWKPETWRYQIGPWRAFYEIDENEKVVVITALEKRADAYR